MYKRAYAQEAETSTDAARGREYQAFEQWIRMLETAEAAGPHSREALDAMLFGRRLWSLLLEDLSREDNALPQELRASLISIGIWLMREIEEIRLGRSENFKGLIEISNTLREGLK